MVAENENFMSENSEYSLHIPYHFSMAGEADELRDILLDFEYIEHKIFNAGPQQSIVDYDLINNFSTHFKDETKAALKLIQNGIRLSADSLDRDSSQLPGQLIGRLTSYEYPEITEFLRQAREWKFKPWLCPLSPSLFLAEMPLQQTLHGHRDTVRAVAMRSDGKTAVSASDDGTLKLWDFQQGTELATLSGNSGNVYSVAITPDGHKAIALSDDTIKIWDLDTCRELHTLTATPHRFVSIAIAPDGLSFVATMNNGELSIWDFKNYECQQTLLNTVNGFGAISFLHDSQQLVASPSIPTLNVWDVKTGQQVHGL